MGNSAIGNREMLQEEELPAFGYPASLRKEMLDYMLAGLRDGGAKVGYRLKVGSVPPAPVDHDGYSGASIVVRRSSGFIEGSPVASAGIGFVVGTAIGAGVMHLARRSS
jgi:hypothetical protein